MAYWVDDAADSLDKAEAVVVLDMEALTSSLLQITKVVLVDFILFNGQIKLLLTC